MNEKMTEMPDDIYAGTMMMLLQAYPGRADLAGRALREGYRLALEWAIENPERLGLQKIQERPDLDGLKAISPFVPPSIEAKGKE